MLVHRELAALLIVAFSTTHNVAALATSGRSLRGPSVELQASPVERELVPGNGNGCGNGGGSGSNGQGPCKEENTSTTTMATTVAAVTTTTSTVKPPLVCGGSLAGQTCTEEDSFCVMETSVCCGNTLEWRCTCSSEGSESGLIYQCVEASACATPCP